MKKYIWKGVLLLFFERWSNLFRRKDDDESNIEFLYKYIYSDSRSHYSYIHRRCSLLRKEFQEERERIGYSRLKKTSGKFQGKYVDNLLGSEQSGALIIVYFFFIHIERLYNLFSSYERLQCICNLYFWSRDPNNWDTFVKSRLSFIRHQSRTWKEIWIVPS